MKPRDDDPGVGSEGSYRDALSGALARIEELERINDALVVENRALLARLSVPGALAHIDANGLLIAARRRLVQRRVRALRRELKAALGVRRYAGSAIVAVTATAAFVVMAAESMTSWPLALAILGMGAVARSLISHWPSFDELEDRRRKLAALKSQLDAIRAEGRSARAMLASSNDGDELAPVREPG